MNNKIYNFTPKQRKKDLRFYKIHWRYEGPMDFLARDEEWCRMAGWWYNKAPADHKRYRNRRYKSKCKAVLRRMIRSEDFDAIFPKNRHDAGWYYW